jgi:hypothetical protein
MRLGSENSIDDEVSRCVFARDRVAIEDDVDQA